MSDAERFWKHTEKVVDGCWLWSAAVNHGGYGLFSKHGGRHQVRAHRYAYELAVGPIPQGLLVLHHCDVRHCVNPEHLWVGTQKDNIADMIAKGRSPTAIEANRRKTHCVRGHPLSGDNVRLIGGNRVCRACRRVFNNRRYAAHLGRPVGRVNRDKTECIRGHPLNGENLYVYTTKGGQKERHCRACQRLRDSRKHG